MLSSQQNSIQWVTVQGYKKGAYFDTVKGGLYQLKLCMLVASRAVQQTAYFVISSEHEGFHKFDDVVIELANGRIFALQAKHAAQAGERYTLKDLLGSGEGKTKTDLSLAKYFDSWIKINADVRFQDAVTAGKIAYVFWTNRTCNSSAPSY